MFVSLKKMFSNLVVLGFRLQLKWVERKFSYVAKLSGNMGKPGGRPIIDSHDIITYRVFLAIGFFTMS